MDRVLYHSEKMEIEKESLIKNGFDVTNACATIPKIITEFYTARNV